MDFQKDQDFGVCRQRGLEALTMVRKPAGAFLMKTMALAALAASTTCSSVASWQP